MKIAFDHQIFSFQQYGGVSRYFFELATRLPDHGIPDVAIVSPLFLNNYLLNASARDITQGRHVPSSSSALPLLLGLANRAVAPIAWRKTHADIVHETYFSPRPVGRARRRVVTVYDMIHELLIPEAKSAIAAKRATVDRADHVICISENTRRDLVRFHDIDPARTSVVHLGCSLPAEAATAEPIDRGRRPSLLYVGQRGGYKNFSTLLEAYSSSTALREFDLVAFGGRSMTNDEEKAIKRLGIGDRVRIESGSDRELAAHYRAASAFVYPSKYEGFGLSPLEAMSHGCPVVCSNAGAIPEVVGDAGVYFDPENVDDLRSAVEGVAMAEDVQSSLRTRGYQRISEFSWDKCALETARIYREIV